MFGSVLQNLLWSYSIGGKSAKKEGERAKKVIADCRIFKNSLKIFSSGFHMKDLEGSRMYITKTYSNKRMFFFLSISI